MARCVLPLIFAVSLGSTGCGFSRGKVSQSQTKKAANTAATKDPTTPDMPSDLASKKSIETKPEISTPLPVSSPVIDQSTSEANPEKSEKKPVTQSQKQPQKKKKSKESKNTRTQQTSQPASKEKPQQKEPIVPTPTSNTISDTSSCVLDLGKSLENLWTALDSIKETPVSSKSGGATKDLVKRAIKSNAVWCTLNEVTKELVCSTDHKGSFPKSDAMDFWKAITSSSTGRQIELLTPCIERDSNMDPIASYVGFKVTKIQCMQKTSIENSNQKTVECKTVQQ